MQCTKCKTENPATAKFCNNCGAKIEKQDKICPNPICKRSGLPEDANFCPDCGTRLAKSEIEALQSFKPNSYSSQSNVGLVGGNILGYGSLHSGTNSGSRSGVLINGVRWSTRNVDVPGTFVASPESIGKLYQWNRKKAWAATGKKVFGWDRSIPSGTTWEVQNDPSPAGWRVPTLNEITKLLDVDKVRRERTKLNGVCGLKFIDKASGNSIFLPAVGYRYNGDGTLRSTDSSGNYWSKTQCDCGYAYDLSDINWSYSRRSSGLSVRPVAK